MQDGLYTGWILISDNHFNEFVIPVNLVVDTYIGILEDVAVKSNVQVYPNPFHEMVNFSFLSEIKTIGNLTITNAMGSTVYSDVINISVGQNLIVWDGKDNRYQKVANGVYFGEISFENQVYFIKIIKRN
jgi:hypothetical protein